MKCVFCGGKHDRLLANSTTKFARYCSTLCIKRAHYVRKNPNTKSFFRDKKEFLTTETGKGYYWERFIAKKIGANHIEFNKGCDLEKDGVLFDVKACQAYKRKLKKGKPTFPKRNVWVFNRNKFKKCDYFICVCLVGKKIEKILQIPSSVFPKSGCTVGEKSKYDQFIIEL